jgi:hypothetical protein
MLSWFKRRLSVRPARLNLDGDATADQPESQLEASSAVSRDTAASEKVKQSNNSKSTPNGTKSKTSASEKSVSVSKTGAKVRASNFFSLCDLVDEFGTSTSPNLIKLQILSLFKRLPGQWDLGGFVGKTNNPKTCSRNNFDNASEGRLGVFFPFLSLNSRFEYQPILPPSFNIPCRRLPSLTITAFDFLLSGPHRPQRNQGQGFQGR